MHSGYFVYVGIIQPYPWAAGCSAEWQPWQRERYRSRQRSASQPGELIFGGSGIVPAAMVAILLNILLPKDKAE